MSAQVKRTIVKTVSILLAVFLCLNYMQIRSFAVSGCTIQKVYTDKARYVPGGTVTITVVINNQTSSSVSTPVNLTITHLEGNTYSTSSSVTVPANQTLNKTFTWTAPAQDFTGYLVNADLGDGAYVNSAIDVSSNPDRFPRYGYTTGFASGESQAQSQALMDDLSQNYHIDLVQYYDWMYRHEQDFPSDQSATSWTDLFGNTISQSTIQQRINAGHSDNQLAMAYQMANMAREGYTANGVSSAWGVYSSKTNNISYNPSDLSTISNIDQLNFPMEGNPSPILFAMNPQNKDWQNYIIGQYKSAVNRLSFDGIQLDQMGNFWSGSKYDFFGNLLDLGKTFSSLVNSTKSQLTANSATKNYVTMNVVNGSVPSSDTYSSWDILNNANTDFEFSELWGNTPSYNSILQYVEYQRKSDNNKTMVVAAYMNQYDNAGTTYEAESAGNNGLSTATSSGTTYVSGFTTGKYLDFTVTAPESGDYTLVFRYTNGTSTRSTKNIYIDGTQRAVGNFDATRTGLIPASPSWTAWSTEACSTNPSMIYLTAGTHHIKIEQDTSNTGDIDLDSMTLGTFNEPSVRLTDAVLAASGVSHIEMGTGLSEANGSSAYSGAVMLGHPYYPKAYKVMRNTLRTAMTNEYNFTTAYENMLYDKDITNADGGLQNISIAGQSVSGSGEAGKIFFVPKNKGDQYAILHLINLTSENDTDWRDVTSEPAAKTNLAVKYYIPSNKSIAGVYLASPDSGNCASSGLSYTTGTDSTGSYISFTVPSLKYWDMVYIKWGTSTEPTVYEAENATKSGVTTNTNHAGYTGTGFVDGYGAVNSSVTFNVNVQSDGYYTLNFRYANATGSECDRDLIIDNVDAGKTAFVNKTNWDTWANAEKGVYLKAGRHTLVLLTTSTYGGYINLDNLTVSPLSESARSLYMNNWADTVYIWKDTDVNNAQALNGSGPGIYELRLSSGYNTNNIKNYSMFLRNETDGVSYTDGSKFESSGYFGSDGVLYNQYKTYNGATLAPQITRAFAVVPNQKFMVVKYTVKNTASTTKTFKILDMLHVNNTGSNNITASYNSSSKAITVNMSNAGQYYIAQGTLESSIDGYQVANDTVGDTSSSLCSPWATFDNNGTLKNNSSVTCNDISTAFMKSVTLQAGASQDVYFYVAAATSAADLANAISAATANSGSYWFGNMSTQYGNWLSGGKTTSFTDSTLNSAYTANLIDIKQSIVPGSNFGAMPASTNPSAYSYKVWARDSAVTAMALDASGHTSEAGQYWTWLSNRQITTNQGGWQQPGTFWTCYWLWDNSSVSFVQPEYDSIGMFLVGAYRHYQSLSGTAQSSFLSSIWASYKRSADFVLNNIQSNGFGPEDCSIWEETNEYNTFTQALYVAGLEAAGEMAKAQGLTSVADGYNGGASTIRSAINRQSTDSSAGLWNSTNASSSYFNRAVNNDGTARTTVDSSSDVLGVYGIVDMLSARGYDHYGTITGALQSNLYGIARYPNDTFYTGANNYDPGGDEALDNSPSWPQMSMWVAMMELYSGYDSLKTNGIRRLQWYASSCGQGYMAPGEEVSNVSLKPAISTMVEPITAASYILTSLAYNGENDTRIVPSQYNAGANQSITVNTGCANTSNQYRSIADWNQWSYVPYYQDATGDNTSGNSTRDIKKTYICNDSSNVYIRIDNVGQSLPGYNVSSDKFSVAVYTEDFAHSYANGTGTSLYGGSLGRAMNYMFVRSSDSGSFTTYASNGSGWANAASITSVVAPQWECSSGRIEMVIPRSYLSSTGSVADNSWANMVISLGSNTGSGWSDADMINIHYRMTPSGTAWLFGNSES